MAGTGGKRPGAGRPKGSKNRLKKDTTKQLAAAGLLPLEYMLAVMRNEKASEARRDDMAKAAAPYCHPRQGVINPEVIPAAPKPVEVENVIAFDDFAPKR